MPFIKMRYIVDKDDYTWETDLKDEKIFDVITDFLRTQMGLGKDTQTPNEFPVYEVEINLDLSDDSFRVKSNTGNNSLMTGIVAHFLDKKDRFRLLKESA